MGRPRTRTVCSPRLATVNAMAVRPPEPFSSRIARRHRLWWGRPGRGGRTFGDALHRLNERRSTRRRDDPDEAWRCCAYWPRTLLDKWNAREFAARHGCTIPELYWHGATSESVPLESLPSDFVVRPVRGTDKRGVLVVAGGRELLGDQPVSPEQIRTRVGRPRRLGRGMPILVEERIGSGDGRNGLPLECKCHAFADAIVAVQVIERTPGSQASHRFYTPSWEPFADPINVGLPLAEVRRPPACLEEMLALAGRLGTAIATYMRIDFFATDRTPVFNEFSSTPRGALRGEITPYGESLFGSQWAERCPETS
jgi:hypothetical protein